MLKINERGQSLIEVLVVGVVSAIMIIALIMIILNSLKNAQFAQNQTQATKIAQDTIDKIRILRDNNANGTLIPKIGSGAPLSSYCFSELWNNLSSYFNCSAGSGFCFYELKSIPTTLNHLGNTDDTSTKITLTGSFTRQIKVKQFSSDEVIVTAVINWTDTSGEHSSTLETIITKPNYDCIQ